MQRFLAFVLLASLYTACDDSENKPQSEIVRVAVNYASSADQIPEQSEAYKVVILLEEDAKADGELEILLSGEAPYGVLFTTIPVANDGKLHLPVAKGDAEISFSIQPVNNAKLNGNKVQTFSIANATGAVMLGESVEFTVTLLDDELTNRLQLQEKNGSALSYNKSSYEYNEDGRVSKVNWETKTVFGTNTGIDEYFYNETGGITHISRFDGAQQTKFTWDEGLIVKVEQIQNDVVMSYNVYEYYETGLVRNVDLFTKNTEGDFVSNTYISYSYLEDANVHKIVQYSFNQNEDVFVVAMTTTYEGYVDGHNPTPLEVLPNQKIQTKLPTYYSRETASGLQEYTVAYEFSENGNLAKKTVTGAVADSGTTTYTYY